MKVRKSSKAIILNSKEELFLFKFEFAMLSEHRTLWVTPGGGVNANESYEQALKRELFEELGIEFQGPYRLLYYRNKPFTKKSGEEFMFEERYYLVKLNDIRFSFENMTCTEKKFTKDWKWWPLNEIENSSEMFFADDLYAKLNDIIRGNIPTKRQKSSIR